jgi:hypothetical protein
MSSLADPFDIPYYSNQNSGFSGSGMEMGFGHVILVCEYDNLICLS